MALDDPVFVVNALKLQEGLAQFLYVTIAFGGPHESKGTDDPRKAISDWKSWDVNWLPWSCRRVKP
jgi:hypothetical protein